MRDLDPSRHRVLLVGPRIVHLRPMFEKRAYPVVAAPRGVEGMAHLDTDPCDLIVLELNLGDLTATEFLMAARQGHPRATFLLVDEAARGSQIVKALQAGLDGYLATPPDEDRLFYEVERHLLRASPEEPDISGFEENSTQTTMTMAEVDPTRGPDGVQELQEQLESARETIEVLQRDVLRFEDDARRHAEVQNVLGGHLEARLDGDEAMRLRERLSLAQVAEIELQTLRGDVQNLKAAKRDNEARVEELLRDLRMARAAIAANDEARATQETAAPEPPGKLAELEAELERWRRRTSELEITLAAATKALSSAEEEIETAGFEARAEMKGELDDAQAKLAEATEMQGLMQAEIDRLTGVAQRAESAKVDVDGALLEAQAELAALKSRVTDVEARGAEDDIRRSAETEDAIAAAVDAVREELAEAHKSAIASAVQGERARLAREQTAALEMAMSAATTSEREKSQAAMAKAIAEQKQQAAQAQRVAIDAAVTEAVAVTRAEAGASLDELVAAAENKARLARERADDFELQLEEARTRVEFLVEDQGRVQADADQRVAAAEAEFKKEKLRLVEEKQAAASGSQEAVLKLERYREEIAQAKREAEALREGQDDIEARLEEALELSANAEREARTAREDRDRERERAVAAMDAVERIEATIGALQAHARNLEASEAAAVAAAEAAEAAQGTAIAAVADAVHRAEVAAEAAAAATASLVSERARADEATANAARISDEILDIRARATVDAEDAQKAAETAAAAMAAAVQSHSAALQAMAAEKAAVEAERQSLETQLADALASLSKATDALANQSAAAGQSADAAIMAAREEAEARAMAAIESVNAELARVRTEAQHIHAQAAQSVSDAHQALAAAATANQQVQSERDALRQTVATLEAKLFAQPSSPTNGVDHGAEVVALGERIRELEHSLSSVDPAMMATVRSLVEAVDPLRWGLGAAIDYLDPIEGTDQSLAGHVRNLRLLQATLARLVAESGKGAGTG